MAAAAPLAIKLGAMVAAHYAAKKLSGPSKAQTQTQQGISTAGQQVGAAAQPLLAQGTALSGQGEIGRAHV